MRILCFLGSFALSTLLANAATYYVDSVKGSDQNNGSEQAPFQNVSRAISRAAAGDVIQFVPGQPLIHQSIVINNKSGTAEAPITIDGGNNTLVGTLPVDREGWQQVSPGLYRSTQLMAGSLEPGNAQRNNPQVNRMFFVFDGQPVLMGRSSKGSRAPFKKPEDLQPGEWTFDNAEAVFYIAISPNQSLEDARIEVPVLQNGLATRGTTNHWRIRNLKVKRFVNDGFNFHGSSRDFMLENIAAEECGDDGMSAHGDCHVEVDGFVSKRNSTGICHIDNSHSINRNVVLEDNTAINLYLLGTGKHEFHHSRISSQNSGIRVGPKEQDSVELKLFHSQISWPAGK